MVYVGVWYVDQCRKFMNPGIFGLPSQAPPAELEGLGALASCRVKPKSHVHDCASLVAHSHMRHSYAVDLLLPVHGDEDYVVLGAACATVMHTDGHSLI